MSQEEKKEKAKTTGRSKKPSGNYYDQKPKLAGGHKSALREQFSKGLGTFVVIAASIAFYFLFYRLGDIFKGLGAALSALKLLISMISI